MIGYKGYSRSARDHTVFTEDTLLMKIPTHLCSAQYLLVSGSHDIISKTFTRFVLTRL